MIVALIGLLVWALCPWPRVGTIGLALFTAGSAVVLSHIDHAHRLL